MPETGCAQRYLAHDALNGIGQAVARIDDATGGTEHRARFEAYLAHAQDRDLSLGVAMTDAKGDRSLKPHQQPNPEAYVRVVERNARGIVISGAKAIVTGGPYMHELLVMPSRNMGAEDADFAVCCAVRVDEPGITLVSRPAGRPGEKLEHGDALFSRKYGQATAVVLFDRVFVPWERVFYAGDWEHSHVLTYSYATHHRHSCIAARAGFGNLLIGAGALMCEANGLDPDVKANLREPMVELIKITEGFYACGVAASVYATRDEHSGSFMPDPVFSNIGKLLLATQIYDMHRLAHEVSGGLIVALPGPDEDHNPATAARLSEALQANPAVPYDRRIQTARFIEDLTASYQGGWYSVISLHGGGSPAAMKQEIWRNYPLGSKVPWWKVEGACCMARARPRAEPPARTLLRHGVQRAGTAHHGALARAQALIDASRSSGCTISSRASRRVAPRFSMACQRGFCRRSCHSGSSMRASAGSPAASRVA